MKNMYKLNYVWYDGEGESFNILTSLSQEEFENYLKEKINSYEDVKYLPDLFDKLIKDMEKEEDFSIAYNVYEEYNIDEISEETEGKLKIKYVVDRKDEKWTRI